MKNWAAINGQKHVSYCRYVIDANSMDDENSRFSALFHQPRVLAGTVP